VVPVEEVDDREPAPPQRWDRPILFELEHAADARQESCCPLNALARRMLLQALPQSQASSLDVMLV
jgi:hypothetical protein